MTLNWFLVILFWNPAIQGFDVADGWYPLPFPTQTICEMKQDFVEMYVPAAIPNSGVVIDCVEAENMYDAITQLQEGS